MQALHYQKIALLKADRTFRTSIGMMLMLPIILTVASAVMAWAILAGHLPWFLWLSVAIMAPLVVLVVSINVLPALRGTNWVLKIQGSTLYLNLRNYRNARLPDDGPTVIVIDAREIASVGERQDRYSVRTNGRQTNWTEKRLEIRLKDDIPSEIKDALAKELTRRPPQTGIVRLGSYYPSPVSMPEERTVRILWLGKFDVVLPRLVRAIEALEPFVPVHEREIVDRNNVPRLNAKDVDQLILDLCAAGDRLGAIKLLTSERGYSLTAAKEFVDSLG